jgi:hypothetical protein
MALSSTSIANPLYAGAISERLTKANHVTWKAQVLAVLRGAHLVGHFTGTVKPPSQEIDGKEKDEWVPNPAYEEWYASDHQVIGLFSSISKEVLPQIATNDIAADAWKEIKGMFLSHNRARKVNTQLQLATTQKGNLSIAQYVNKMAAAARVIEEKELVEYILSGLGQEYYPIVSAIIAKTAPVPINEIYSQLQTFETRQALMNRHEGGGSSVNSASRDRGCSGRGGFCTGGSHDTFSSGSRGGFDRGGSGRSGYSCGRYTSSSTDKDPICQVSKKRRHTVGWCCHHFDEDYIPEERTVAATTAPHHGDNSWYTDSGATDHITSDLVKLSIQDKYTGNDQIHTASGSSMNMSHNGHNTIHTLCHQL